MKSLNLQNSVDHIEIDSFKLPDESTLITIITTTFEGTKNEKFTVAQIQGENVEKLKDYINSL